MPISPIVARSSVGASGTEAAADLAHLRAVNPNLDRILRENPGVQRFLDVHAARGAVWDGGLAPDEQKTTVSWTIWNHSELTAIGHNGYPAYRHGMKDEDILKKDVLVVWQEGGNGQLDLGRFRGSGQIVGVYQLQDLVRGGRWADGGFSGQMNVVGHGKAGEKGVMAWAVVSIGGDGRVLGGGYPARGPNGALPYQELVRAGRKPPGGEYAGRAAEVVHGRANQVGLVDL